MRRDWDRLISFWIVTVIVIEAARMPGHEAAFTAPKTALSFMKPITFACSEILPLAPESIAEGILDVAHWSDFQGYGVLPGIQVAEFEIRTPQVVGSRIRVRNTDGSQHVEEIVEWEPKRRIRMELKEFAAPLSRLAIAFEETWDLERLATGSRVVRSFRMQPRSRWTRPALWLISQLLRRAVARHLRTMRSARRV